MDRREEQLQAFSRLLDVMGELRAKCPWDKKQTMESLRYLTIEETYELTDAILEKDMEEIKKELGDVLLHIVFYSKIASEKKAFDIKDVMDSLCEKLIYRHPHIYGDVDVKDEVDVKRNWEKLKLKKGNKSVLSGVPKSLPSMVQAMRIQEKAADIGFDWKEKATVWKKVEEEIDELKVEEEKQSEQMEDELGDVFFSIINYARFLDIDPDAALKKTNRKFINRFQFIEREAKKEGKNIDEMSLEEMDTYWEKAKTAN